MTDLAAHVGVEWPRLSVDLTITASRGSVLAVLGPNGAGKSTLVRALAGLLRLSAGTVRLGDLILDDPGRRVHVPADSRPVGVVFQDHLLFPHLDARDNVAYGLRARGIARATARAAAAGWLERVGVADLADARPRQMSGGQSQRVALARALAVAPQLLLLDEPLAALDVDTRSHVRGVLRTAVADYDGVTLLVTHDPLDALVLADSVVIVENGTVTQSGAPAEVARRPRTDYVARLMGMNVLAGRAATAGVALRDGGHLTTRATAHGDVLVAIRPSAITLFADRPQSSARNTWPGVVTGVEGRGDVARVAISGPPDVVADVTSAAVAALRLAPGSRVWCAAKATDLDVYPQ